MNLGKPTGVFVLEQDCLTVSKLLHALNFQKDKPCQIDDDSPPIYAIQSDNPDQSGSYAEFGSAVQVYPDSQHIIVGCPRCSINGKLVL